MKNSGVLGLWTATELSKTGVKLGARKMVGHGRLREFRPQRSRSRAVFKAEVGAGGGWLRTCVGGFRVGHA